MGRAREGHHGDAGRDVAAEEIGEAAHALFYAMRKARSAGADQVGGLSLPQLALLEPLAAQSGLPVSRLAAAAKGQRSHRDPDAAATGGPGHRGTPPGGAR